MKSNSIGGNSLGNSQLNPRSELIIGIAGAVASLFCVAITGVVFFASSVVVDPSLMAALAPLMLAFFLIVGTGVALANGTLWLVLVRKKGRGAIPWMLLSLVGAFAAPWIVLLGLVLICSVPSADPPKANELFCCCGMPGIISGLLILAFWVSQSKALPAKKNNTTSQPAEPMPQQHSVHSPATRPRRGFDGFCLGTVISALIAGIFGLLFGVAIFFVLQAEANSLPSSGGFGLDFSGLDTAFYVIVLLVSTLAVTFVVSGILMFVIIAPKMPTGTSKIINPVLFTLLSIILNLVFDMVIFTILFIKLDPI